MTYRDRGSNLLSLLFEVSRQIPLGQVDSTLERGIDEIKFIYMEYVKDMITEQIVIDRLENILKSIKESKNGERYILCLESCVENTIPMFKCFLSSSSSSSSN